jgi:riboflavin synthase
MFTGIITATGSISALEKAEDSCRLTISSKEMDFSDLSVGDSVAVSGVCLTAVEFGKKSFVADVSNETLACTNLGRLGIGASVNLEKALRVDDRLGGHIVSGHVDGLAILEAIESDGDSLRLEFSAPKSLAHYIAKKGSVCLDGVSLTVNEVQGEKFYVNIIPHTAGKTGIGGYGIGQEVNLEVDLLSRYLERLMQKKDDPAGQGEMQTGITWEKLKASGFVK